MISFVKTLLGFLIGLLAISCSQPNEQTQKQTLQETPEELADTITTIHYDWNPPAYTTVKAYLLRPQLISSAANLGMANEPEDFFAKIKYEKGIELSKEQVSGISSRFSVEAEESEYLPADCFDPRHAIVYYDIEEPVAAIVVCFECGKLYTYPKFEQKISLHNYLKNFDPFFVKLGMPVFSNPVEYDAYMDSVQAIGKRKK